MLFLSHFSQDLGDFCGCECQASDICHVCFVFTFISAEFAFNIASSK